MKGFLSFLYLVTVIPVSLIGMVWGWGLHAENWGWVAFSYLYVIIIPAFISLLSED